jgi:hypothetical protein
MGKAIRLPHTNDLAALYEQPSDKRDSERSVGTVRQRMKILGGASKMQVKHIKAAGPTIAKVQRRNDKEGNR